MIHRNMMLVLLAGQSNMAGRGVAGTDDLTAFPGLYYFTGNHDWQPAVEPITRDRPFVGTFRANGEKVTSPDPWDNIPVPSEAGARVVGVGPGRTFGRLLAEANPGREIGLIPAAVGGTPILSWKRGEIDKHDPGKHPYDDAVALASAARQYGEIVAVLWHQGETDAVQNNVNYRDDLFEVIAAFRRDLRLADSVPFILGELGDFYKEDIMKHAGMINGAMHEAAAKLPGVGVVGTAGLIHHGDFLHFDTPSAHRLGERYFAKYLRMRQK